VNDWLALRADRLAEASTVDRSTLELNDTQIQQLLDLAGFAAHDSGDRTNAPLLCYLVGVAAATGKSVADLSAEVR
jgi:hypothetical protein